MAEIMSPQARRIGAPRWLDFRLLVGIALVLGSVWLGVRAYTGGQPNHAAWTVTHSMAAGSRLRAEDLRAVRISIPAESERRYLDANAAKPVGYLLATNVGPGELLPAQALVTPDQAQQERRFVTVAVRGYHLPSDLAVGQVVDVYVTPSAGSAAEQGPARLVIPSATVSAVNRPSRVGFGGSLDQVGVELSVLPAQAADLVGAMQAGVIDLVRVPIGSS